MRTHRSRPMASALLVATVLFAAGGLLLMHGITSASQGSVQTMHDTATSIGPMVDAPVHVMTRSPAHDSMELHELLDCVWVLVGGLILAAGVAWIARWQPPAQAAASAFRRMRRRAQRAPPTAVRLSLVGTARC